METKEKREKREKELNDFIEKTYLEHVKNVNWEHVNPTKIRKIYNILKGISS